MSMEPIQELMESENFFQENPKTLQQLLKWELSNLKRLQTKIAEAGEEEDTEFSLQEEDIKSMVFGAFAMSPRFLFEFLDMQDIIVEITKDYHGFHYAVNGQKEPNVFFKTRLEAEKQGFRKAISTLEGQLGK